MPGIDEDVLRELMHRATDDLHAPSAVTAGIVTGQRRRHWRNRAAGAALTGVAAGMAFGVATAVSGGSHPTTSAPAVRLTAAQHELYRLSSAAAAAPQPSGRYVKLTEKDDGGLNRTSVIDSLTGDTWTYQRGAGVPSELPVARHGSPTQAEFATWPTGPAALRAMLLTQAQQQQAQGQQQLQQKLGQMSAKARARVQAALAKQQVTSDDLVFEQASDTLWNPLVGPALRSALYKVLAQTPGVVVDAHATDMSGQPAVEISRVDNGQGEATATFEDAATGRVLESLFITPADPAKGVTGSTLYDLYTSVTSSSTLPPNPYRN
jgi:hypothetical protein